MNQQNAKTPSDQTTSKEGAEKPLAWWQVKMVWLVIAGPLIVVIAAVSTAVVAIRGQDPVLVTGPEDLQVDPGKKNHPSYRSAMEGRNHATTGGVKP
ncbi:MAG: hypothetical protein AB3X41_05645 [Leptothrix ochracea]|uniref:hypothetical protein n=1 Tax=Leptothrix ochracea TaxID=735331 RepID=UPI0034E1E181